MPPSLASIVTGYSPFGEWTLFGHPTTENNGGYFHFFHLDAVAVNDMIWHFNSGVPVRLNLGHCPIKNPKCPIVFSKPGQNVRLKPNFDVHTQNICCEFLLLHRLKISWSLGNNSQIC